MLTEICQFLRNWFERDIISSNFVISGGTITAADGTALPLLSGQYYRIVGSVLNDGVHKYEDNKDVLVDEVFNGAVWSMAIPPDFLALVADITSWCAANAEAINTPYQSESFGGYSYSLKNSGYASGGENGVTWQSQFKARLSPWRKI